MTEAYLKGASGNVLLIGGYGAGNLGDEAILRGILKSVEEDTAIDSLTVISHDPDDTEGLHREYAGGFDFSAIAPGPVSLGKMLFTHDCFFIGGGGIFSRYMGPYASKIPYYAAGALAVRKPVHWTALGAYASTPSWTMRVLKTVMKRSSSISVRDPISQKTLTDEGVSGVELVDDPAMILDPTDADIDLPDDQRTIGIAARRVKDDENTEQLLAAYRDTATAFRERGWNVVFLPFTSHPNEELEQDNTVCEMIAGEHDSYGYFETTDPQEMLGVVDAVDAMVATRLHSTIFAERVGTPYVAIEYAPKVTSFLEHQGESDRGIALEAVRDDKISDILSRYL